MEKEGVGMALPIAIVEDQTPDAQRLEELLQQQLPAAECTWFTCGDDFLRAAAEPGLYAVVFLDICMAGTNGIETARRLRQADPEVLIGAGAGDPHCPPEHSTAAAQGAVRHCPEPLRPYHHRGW